MNIKRIVLLLNLVVLDSIHAMEAEKQQRTNKEQDNSRTLVLEKTTIQADNNRCSIIVTQEEFDRIKKFLKASRLGNAGEQKTTEAPQCQR